MAVSLKREYRLNQHPNDIHEKAMRLIMPCSKEKSTLEVVRGIIRRAKPCKAPGPEKISNRVFKRLARKAVMTLKKHREYYVSDKTLSRQMENRRCEVLKVGTYPQNNLPISLVRAMNIIAERVILTKIKETSEATGMLPDERYQFRSCHSSEQ